MCERMRYTMKKMLSKLAVLLVVALVMGLGVALPAMADPPTAVLRKTLLMPEHVVLNAPMTFTFNFEPVGTAPALAVGVAPNPNQMTITIPATTTSPTSISNNTAILAALELLRSNPALNAGAYEWIVSEVVPAQNPSAAGVTYDTSRFLMRVYFSNNMLNGVVQTPPLNISTVLFFPILSAPGVSPIELDDKVDIMEFVNRFAPQDIGNDGRPALRVSKVITNDVNRPYANLDTPFSFNITLNAPTFNPPIDSVTPELPATITGTIVNSATGLPIADDGTQTVTFTVAGNRLTATASFQLRDGQELRISTLPGGTTYIVEELPAPGFAPSATVVIGGNPTPTSPYAPTPVSGTTVGLGLTVDNGVVSNATAGEPPVLQRNSADFFNAYHRTPPTGLVIANMPFFAAGFAALTLALMLTSRSRKRIEEMPIAY